MPVVPEIVPNAARPAYDSSRGATPEAFGSSIGRASGALGGALFELGQTLDRKREEENKLWLENELTQLQIGWADEEAQIRREVESDPVNNVNADERVSAAFRDSKNFFMEKINQNRKISDKLKQAVGVQLAQMEARVGIGAVTLEEDRITRSTVVQIDDVINLALNEVQSSPDLLESRLAAVSNKIERSREALGPEADKTLIQAGRSLTNAHVLGRIQQNPEQTLKALHDGEFDSSLSADDKARAIASGYREIEDRARRADRAEAAFLREQRETKERNFEFLLVRMARGEIEGEEFVNALDQGLITAADYRTLEADRRALVLNDEGDPWLRNQMEVLILSNEATMQDLIKIGSAFNPEQFSYLVGKADEVARRGGAFAREDVKLAMNQIKDVAGGASGPWATFDQVSIDRQVRALQYFRSHLEPDASNLELLQEEVMRRFRAPHAGVTGSEWEFPSWDGFDGTIFGRPVSDQTYTVIEEALAIVNQEYELGNIDEDTWAFRVTILGQAHETVQMRLNPAEEIN